MNPTDSNSSGPPSTPPRAKRTSGTKNKSPHNISNFSPLKKKNHIAPNTNNHVLGPAIDFHIPTGIASLETQTDEDGAVKNAYSPMKSSGGCTDEDLDMLADIGLGVAVEDVEDIDMLANFDPGVSVKELIPS